MSQLRIVTTGIEGKRPSLSQLNTPRVSREGLPPGEKWGSFATHPEIKFYSLLLPFWALSKCFSLQSSNFWAETEAYI